LRIRFSDKYLDGIIPGGRYVLTSSQQA